MIGVPMSNDRRWQIQTPEFAAELTDYNWEITGVDERLHALDPKVFRYGGNAYYATGRYAFEHGYAVYEIGAHR